MGVLFAAMREVWLLVLDFSLDWFMIFFGAIIRKFLELILLILERVLKEGLGKGVLLRGEGSFCEGASNWRMGHSGSFRMLLTMGCFFSFISLVSEGYKFFLL